MFFKRKQLPDGSPISGAENANLALIERWHLKNYEWAAAYISILEKRIVDLEQQCSKCEHKRRSCND